jgi:hypothetical protein
VGGAFFHGGDDGFGGRKIHVRDPHGDYIVAAEHVFNGVPFDTVSIGAVAFQVEVIFHIQDSFWTGNFLRRMIYRGCSEIVIGNMWIPDQVGNDKPGKTASSLA